MPSKAHPRTARRIYVKLEDDIGQILMHDAKLLIDPQSKKSSLLLFVPNDAYSGPYHAIISKIYEEIGGGKEKITPLTFAHQPAKMKIKSYGKVGHRAQTGSTPTRDELEVDTCLRVDLGVAQTARFKEKFDQYLRGPGAKEDVELDDQQKVARAAKDFILGKVAARDL